MPRERLALWDLRERLETKELVVKSDNPENPESLENVVTMVYQEFPEPKVREYH